MLLHLNRHFIVEERRYSVRRQRSIELPNLLTFEKSIGAITHSDGSVSGVASSPIQCLPNREDSADGHRIYRERECIIVAKGFSLLARLTGKAAQGDLARA